HLKDLVAGIPAGTVYRQVAGGGGGDGDPHLRPVERVLAEARNGMISLVSARRDYGVAIDPETWTGDGGARAAARGLRGRGRGAAGGTGRSGRSGRVRLP